MIWIASTGQHTVIAWMHSIRDTFFLNDLPLCSGLLIYQVAVLLAHLQILGGLRLGQVLRPCPPALLDDGIRQAAGVIRRD